MYKKAQGIFAGILIVVMVFIAVTQLITPLKFFITDARDVSSLDCDNSSISVGQSGACVVTDWMMFYFIGSVMAAAVAYLGFKELEKRSG